MANDSNPSALYRNNRDGTFTDIGVAAGCAYSQDGKPQAGMGVAVGDYNRDGRMDIFKTNFAGDTSTLYANNGNGLCEDRTFASGFGRNTRWLGWGVAFLDLDLDGWQDLFLVNGHVYPEVEQLKSEAGYRQRKVVYRNRGDGRFDDVTEQLGPPVTVPKAGRGAAFADFDNDGDVDVLVSNVHDTPELYRLDQRQPRNLGGAAARGRDVEPQRHRRERQADRRRRHAGRAKCAAAAATTRRTTCACTSGSAAATVHRSRRGPLAERSRRAMDRLSRPTASSRSPKAAGALWQTKRGNDDRARGPGGDALRRPRPRRRTLAEARRLINAGQPARAIEQLKTIAADQDPAVQLQAGLLLGVAHYHADDPAKAVEVLTPIVDRLPRDSIERREAEQVLGLAAVRRRQIRRGRAAARGDAALGAGQHAAGLCAGAGLPSDAAGGCAPAPCSPSSSRSRRDSAAAHLIAAQMMTRLEMDSLAEPELTKALEKDPRLPSANLLLGQIALFRGRIPEAITFTSRELAINPASAMAFSQLGDAYVRQAQWDDAIATLQKSIWLNPYYSAPYILMGRAYMKKAQPAVAEGMLRRAIEFDPNNRAAHYLLAQLLQQTGREDEAKREFEIAEKLRSPRER